METFEERVLRDLSEVKVSVARLEEKVITRSEWQESKDQVTKSRRAAALAVAPALVAMILHFI